MKQNWTLKAMFTALSAVALIGIAGQAMANEEIIKRSKDGTWSKLGYASPQPIKRH